MASRAELIALVALKKARRRPARGEAGKPGATVVIREVQEAAPAPVVAWKNAPPPEVLHGMDGRSVDDIRIEQKGAELTFIFTMTDGGEIRRKVTLPKGVDGSAAGAFFVRNGIRQPVDFSFTTATATGDATATTGRYIYLVDASAGPVTITLPAIGETGAAQSEYIVQKVDSSPNPVYAASPSNINGGASFGVVQQRSAMHIYWSDTADGWVIG